MPELNFIVHPEFAIMSTDERSVLEYSKKISEIAKSDNTYVITTEVYPTFENDFQRDIFLNLYTHDLVDSDKILRSNGFFADGDYVPYGHVKNSDWDSLTTILKDNAEEIRIHGCFFGNACLKNLAIQLYSQVYEDKHLYNWNDIPPISQVIKESIQSEFTELKESLKKSNIKYGVIYSNDFVGQRESVHFIPRFLFRSSLDEQLVDKKTEIYGMNKIL